MIEIEAPDGTIVEFPAGTPDDVIIRVMRENFPAAPQAQAGEGGASGSWGPSVPEDVAKSAGSGLLQGIAGIGDMPGALMNAYSGLLTGGLERAGIVSPEFANQMQQGMIGAVPGGGDAARKAIEFASMGGSEYQPQTTAGEYAQTAGEFVPGSLLGGPTIGTALRYGVGAGLASEAAGQATEGTALEPFARAAAALAVPALTARAGRFMAGDESADMANRLRESGVRGVTAGQARGSAGLMRAEGRLEPTAQQLDDYTRAIMGQIGSAAPKATPEALRKAGDAIVKQMDDAVAGVNLTPTIDQASEAARVAARYAERVPAGQLTPRVKGIANEIIKSSAAKKPIDLSQLKEWRSDIGNLTVSPDAATREAAHMLRTMIDDMTDQALTAAGRTDDIAKLAQGREAYRNFIGIRDAASRAGAEAGTLSPQALNQSIIRSQGREAYATGRTTPMAELTRAGAAVLRPAPTVAAGGQRAIMGALPAGLASIGGAAAYGAGAGPLGLLAGGLAGAAAPAVGQAAMRSGPMQAALRDPASIPAGIARLLPGLLGQ